MRVAVGLTPVYFAALILLFEAVREPSIFLRLFSTPSGAEEVAHESDARPGQEVALGQDVSGNVPENTSAVESTGGPAPVPARAATYMAARAVTAPVSESEKSAFDRAKSAGVPASEKAGMAFGGPPSEAAVGTSASAEASPQGPDGLSAERMPHTLNGPHPDPRAGVAPLAEVPIDPAAAEAAEQALALSRGDRREIQRRLRFAAFDPELIDGIFGPDTRAAIAAWQDAAGLPATGYMDEPAMALLVEQTADEHRAWRAAERARVRREEEEADSAVVVSSAQPWPSPLPEDKCRRLPSGEIAFGSDVGCNFRAFGENFRRDFRGLKGSLRELFQ